MQYAWVHLTVHRVGQKSKSDALTPELKAFVEDSVYLCGYWNPSFGPYMFSKILSHMSSPDSYF